MSEGGFQCPHEELLGKLAERSDAILSSVNKLNTDMNGHFDEVNGRVGRLETWRTWCVGFIVGMTVAFGSQFDSIRDALLGGFGGPR